MSLRYRPLTGERKMSGNYKVEIAVRVTDPAALRAAAIKSYASFNAKATKDEIDDAFGPEDDINVSACLIELFDPGESPEGTSILESSVN